MKSFIAILALVAVAAADVSHLQSGEGGAQIVKLEADIGLDGYIYSYETNNGIGAQESGSLKKFGPDAAAVVSEGQFAYTAPGGEQISLSYVADENGFQPRGSHLPTPPPIPEEILRSIEFIRANPPKEPRA